MKMTQNDTMGPNATQSDTWVHNRTHKDTIRHMGHTTTYWDRIGHILLLHTQRSETQRFSFDGHWSIQKRKVIGFLPLRFFFYIEKKLIMKHINSKKRKKREKNKECKSYIP